VLESGRVQLCSSFLNPRNVARLLDVKHSVAPWSVFVIGNALTCSLSKDVPLLNMSTQRPGTSLHMISFARPSPVLVLQVTNAGVRRPGYEASTGRLHV